MSPILVISPTNKKDKLAFFRVCKKFDGNSKKRIFSSRKDKIIPIKNIYIYSKRYRHLTKLNTQTFFFFMKTENKNNFIDIVLTMFTDKRYMQDWNIAV